MKIKFKKYYENKIYVPFELTIPSNGCENVKCTSMWSLPHITSNETMFGIPSGLSIGHNSLPAKTKLNCKTKEITKEKYN